VWGVARNNSPQLEELGAGVFVGGDRGAEGNHAQVLQPVVQFEETSVAQFPGAVSGREGFDMEGRQTQQVVAAPLDQIDGQVVARIHTKLGADGVAHRQSLPLQVPAEGTVLGTHQLGDVEQGPEGVQVPDPAKGHEHRAELETKKLRHGLSDGSEQRHGLLPIPVLGGGAGK
jgi:hypothetical protein